MTVTISRHENGGVHVYDTGGGKTWDPEAWPTFRKTVLTHALRMEGEFTVHTSEGELTCKDGYLAVDARGYPYPIAVDEFELIYEPAAELPGGDLG